MQTLSERPALSIDSGNLISFAEAARIVKASVVSLHRWRLLGCRGVRLEALAVGQKWHTSRESLQHFCEQLTAARRGKTRTPTVQADDARLTTRERDRVDAADREAEALLT